MISGANSPVEARSQSSSVTAKAFLALLGEPISPVVGSAAITPTLSLALSFPRWVKYSFAVSIRGMEAPPPVPPATPRQMIILSMLSPKTCRILLKTSCSDFLKAALPFSRSFPAPSWPRWDIWNFCSSGKFKGFKSCLAVLIARHL